MSGRVLGVDFSGASDAGRDIWLTAARDDPDGLVVEECVRAADRFGADREAAHAGLRDRLPAFDVAALDFPFSLPTTVLDACCGGTWGGFVEWLADDGPDGPGAFATACREAARANTPDERAALRRETDLRRGALCPYGRRVQYQTFYGVRDVLGGVADREDVAVAPMQGPATGGEASERVDGDGTTADTVVVETYPAATFGWLGAYREGYKGEVRARRERNVAVIEECGVELGEARETYCEHHDALDSLAAAVSAGRVAGGAAPNPYGPDEEGRIYV